MRPTEEVGMYKNQAAEESFKGCLPTDPQIRKKKKKVCQKLSNKPMKKALLIVIKMAHTYIALTLWKVLL